MERGLGGEVTRRATTRELINSAVNSGTQHTVGPLYNIYGTLFNTPYGDFGDVDIYYNPATNTNVGYVSHLVSGNIAATSFYTLALATGILTYVGQFGTITPGNNLPIVMNIALIPATPLPIRPAELTTDLTLYPNPAAGSLRLSFGLARAAHAELVVTDLLGRAVAAVDAGMLPAPRPCAGSGVARRRAFISFPCASMGSRPAPAAPCWSSRCPPFTIRCFLPPSMPHNLTRWATACKLLLLALVLAGAARPAAAQTVYGLLQGYKFAPATTPAYALVAFDAATPGTFTSVVPITGISNPYEVIAIDVRPATGELFALGYNGTQAQLYKLRPATGVLTAVGTGLALNLSNSYYHSIGFDFDPTTDRIRVTSTTRTNYRLDPNTGALDATDGLLTYASTDPHASQTPEVSASAHTNSYLGATSSTLYNLDVPYNRLVTQVPANSGTLNTVATLNDGGLPFIISFRPTIPAVDLDIYFNPTTHTNVGYLSQVISGAILNSGLYTVNLTTGAVTLVGGVGPGSGGGLALADIAIASPAPTLAPLTGQLAYALAGPNLLTFDTALPGTIRTSVGITGVAATQTLVGLDMRPATGTLYALGYDAGPVAGVPNAQLYTLNPATGVATAVGPTVRLEVGTGNVGFDFNPAEDHIRVVGANAGNYRLNPLTGAVIGTASLVSYPTGTAAPTIGAVAYTNSYAGATTTTLYNYDQVLNQLNTQATANPPSDGLLTLVGSSGMAVNPAAPTLDLDIYSPGGGVNTAYLVANTGTSPNTSLYTVNLATGAATLVGRIGNGLAARNLAVVVGTNVVTGTRPAALATALALYPNPLAGAATLSFGLARAAHVELVVTDLLGRPVDMLDAGVLPAGAQAVRWTRGSQAAGVYFFSLRFDGQPAGTRRAVLAE